MRQTVAVRAIEKDTGPQPPFLAGCPSGLLVHCPRTLSYWRDAQCRGCTQLPRAKPIVDKRGAVFRVFQAGKAMGRSLPWVSALVPFRSDPEFRRRLCIASTV